MVDTAMMNHHLHFDNNRNCDNFNDNDTVEHMQNNHAIWESGAFNDATTDRLGHAILHENANSSRENLNATQQGRYDNGIAIERARYDNSMITQQSRFDLVQTIERNNTANLTAIEKTAAASQLANAENHAQIRLEMCQNTNQIQLEAQKNAAIQAAALAACCCELKEGHANLRFEMREIESNRVRDELANIRTELQHQRLLNLSVGSPVTLRG